MQKFGLFAYLNFAHLPGNKNYAKTLWVYERIKMQCPKMQSRPPGRLQCEPYGLRSLIRQNIFTRPWF